MYKPCNPIKRQYEDRKMCGLLGYCGCWTRKEETDRRTERELKG